MKKALIVTLLICSSAVHATTIVPTDLELKKIITLNGELEKSAIMKKALRVYLSPKEFNCVFHEAWLTNETIKKRVIDVLSNKSLAHAAKVTDEGRTIIQVHEQDICLSEENPKEAPSVLTVDIEMSEDLKEITFLKLTSKKSVLKEVVEGTLIDPILKKVEVKKLIFSTECTVK